MMKLLNDIIEAHGGINRWNQFSKIEAQIVSGGNLFEMKGVPEETAREAMRLASHKLPVKTKFIRREEA